MTMGYSRRCARGHSRSRSQSLKQSFLSSQRYSKISILSVAPHSFCVATARSETDPHHEDDDGGGGVQRAKIAETRSSSLWLCIKTMRSASRVKIARFSPFQQQRQYERIVGRLVSRSECGQTTTVINSPLRQLPAAPLSMRCYPTVSIPRRYLSLSALPSPGKATTEFRNLGSFYKKVEFILSQERLPIGSMKQEHFDFCTKALYNLSRYFHNKGETTERILERVVQEASVKHSKTLVTVRSYNQAIRAWARTSDDPRAHDNDPIPCYLRAKALLDRMIERHSSNPEIHPAPDVHSYNNVLYAISKSSHAFPGSKLAESMVRTLEQGLRNPQTTVRPTATTYNNLIMTFANQADQHYGAAMAAEDWLLHFSKLCTDGVLGEAQPNTDTFNRVLKAWRISPEDRGADRAAEILQLMMELHKEHNQVAPDYISFSTVIHAFGGRQRPQEAEAVYKQAIEYFRKQQQDHMLTRRKANVSSMVNYQESDLTSCLNAALLAWFQSQNPNSAKRAQHLVSEAYELSKQGLLVPNVASHNILLETYVKEGGIDVADQHLRNMILSFENGSVPAPDTSTFHVVLHGWLNHSSRSGAPERAQQILDLMLQLHRERRAPCAPVSHTFTRCIELWCRQSYSPLIAQKVWTLLEMAEQRNLANFFAYKCAINFLCRSPSTATQAAYASQRLGKLIEKGAIPPLESFGLYTAPIAALSKVKSPEAAELALQVLKEFAPKNLKPSKRAYTGVLAAFSKLQTERSVQVVCSLFEELKRLDAEPSSTGLCLVL